MENSIYQKIGKRIRQIRLENRITLQDVSEKAGVSKGLLSKIENGRTIPSLPVLLQIIKVLNTDASLFFDGIDNDFTSGYLLKKAADYEPVQKEDSEGFHYFSMIAKSFHQFEFQSAVLKLAPGAKRERVSTDGFTFLYLIDGEITYSLDQEKLKMQTGDSLMFDGKIPHVPENTGNSTAILLVVYLLNT